MALRIVFFSEKNDALLDAAFDYIKRCDRRLGVELVRLAPARRKKGMVPEKKEAELLLKQSEGFFRIALDEQGKQLSSTTFSKDIDRHLVEGRKIAFLFGGASGLDQSVLDAADATLSLSKMTMPHRLAVLALCEQVYRAGEISRGSPYHRE